MSASMSASMPTDATTQALFDQDAEPGTFEHRVVPAASAPAPQTRAANSVFSLAAMFPAATGPARDPVQVEHPSKVDPMNETPSFIPRQPARRQRKSTPRSGEVQRARELLDECILQALAERGPQPVVKLCKLVHESNSRQVSKSLERLKYRGKVERADGGKDGGGDPPWRLVDEPYAPPKASVTPPRAAPMVEDSAGGWAASIDSHGRITVEADGQMLRLSCPQALGLLRWLTRIDTLLQAG